MLWFPFPVRFELPDYICGEQVAVGAKTGSATTDSSTDFTDDTNSEDADASIRMYELAVIFPSSRHTERKDSQHSQRPECLNYRGL